MEPIIELNQVTKFFYTHKMRTRALDNIDMVIERGDYISIEGPSGSGKSTLLNVLSLIDKPSQGKVLFFGNEVKHLSRKRLARMRNSDIGFVFQTFNLLGHLTVFENIALPLKYSKSRDNKKNDVDMVLEQLGISHRADHYPHQLSGGQQQRVAVGRAIINKPAIIFADEPTGNLDDDSSNDVIKLLESFHESGSTLCIVTHNRSIAQRAQRHIRIDQGQLKEFSAGSNDA